MKKRSLPHTENLLRIVSELRKKCPWDRKQTHRTLIPYLMEEAYETLEAIRSGKAQSMREELGDLLLQVVLHAEIASEKSGFGFEEIADGIAQKMIRRHPHIYGSEKAALSGKVHSQRWTELKQKEKPKRSMLEGTPRSMPSLQLSQRYGEIVASVGFDWPDVGGVWDKVEEELQELKSEVRAPKRSKKRIEEEFGDLVFCVANLARHLGINAEDAGRNAAIKFAKRFAFIEDAKAKQGKLLSKLSVDEWEDAWQAAKASRKKKTRKVTQTGRLARSSS